MYNSKDFHWLNKKLGLERIMSELGNPFPKKSDKKTYPADCRKIAAVDSNKHDWDWKNRRYWKKKKIFVQKYYLSPIYFDGIS